MRNRTRTTEESLAIALAEHDAKDRRARNAESAHRMALEDGLNKKTAVARSVSDITCCYRGRLHSLVLHIYIASLLYSYLINSVLHVSPLLPVIVMSLDMPTILLNY